MTARELAALVGGQGNGALGTGVRRRSGCEGQRLDKELRQRLLCGVQAEQQVIVRGGQLPPLQRGQLRGDCTALLALPDAWAPRLSGAVSVDKGVASVALAVEAPGAEVHAGLKTWERGCENREGEGRV